MGTIVCGLCIFLLVHFRPICPFATINSRKGLRFSYVFRFVRRSLFRFFRFILMSIRIRFVICLRSRLTLRAFNFRAIRSTGRNGFSSINYATLSQDISHISFNVSPCSHIVKISVQRRAFTLMSHLCVSFFFHRLSTFIRMYASIQVNFRMSFSRLF